MSVSKINNERLVGGRYRNLMTSSEKLKYTYFRKMCIDSRSSNAVESFSLAGHFSKVVENSDIYESERKDRHTEPRSDKKDCTERS